MNDSSKLLLLSGGMDSTTCLWWMDARLSCPIHTLCVDYRQRHRCEIDAAAAVAARARVESHTLLDLDLAALGASLLTDGTVDVPHANEDRQSATVVPFRNHFFVSLAAAHAHSLGVSEVYIAPVRDDYDAYRDCRREFYDSLEETLLLGGPAGHSMRIHTPFVNKWKRDVIALGLELGVPYELTHTCYNGSRPACGRCDACVERIEAFRANRVTDPLAYDVAPGWDDLDRENH